MIVQPRLLGELLVALGAREGLVGRRRVLVWPSTSAGDIDALAVRIRLQVGRESLFGFVSHSAR